MLMDFMEQQHIFSVAKQEVKQRRNQYKPCRSNNSKDRFFDASGK